MRVHTIIDPSFGVNLHLVEAERSVLVDSGTGREHARVAASIHEILGERKLEAILLTHRHFDHVGGVNAAILEFRADAFASPDEAEALRGDALTSGARAFGAELPAVPVRVFSYGQRIDLGDAALEVVHTPGHTSGHVCLFDPVSRTLLSGDCVFANGGVGRWDFPSGDYGQLVASLEKLRKMEVESLYPGHGSTVATAANEHVVMGLESLKEWRQ